MCEHGRCCSSYLGRFSVGVNCVCLGGNDSIERLLPISKQCVRLLSVDSTTPLRCCCASACTAINLFLQRISLVALTCGVLFVVSDTALQTVHLAARLAHLCHERSSVKPGRQRSKLEIDEHWPVYTFQSHGKSLLHCTAWSECDEQQMCLSYSVA